MQLFKLAGKLAQKCTNVNDPAKIYVNYSATSKYVHLSAVQQLRHSFGKR